MFRYFREDCFHRVNPGKSLINKKKETKPTTGGH